MKNTPLRLLAISDVRWEQLGRVKKLIEIAQPTVVTLAGDLTDFPGSADWCRVLLGFLEVRQIRTLAVKGNHDEDAYNALFAEGNYHYIHDISNRYARFAGYTFLGIPYKVFEDREALQRLAGDHARRKVDFVVAHPPTNLRPWVFDVRPKFALLGHDGVRLCQVNDSLLVCTDKSPGSYALINTDGLTTAVTLYDGEARLVGGYTIDKAKMTIKWNTDNDPSIKYYRARWKKGKFRWTTRSHSYDAPPHCYPVKDTIYGREMGKLILLKQRFRRSQSNACVAGVRINLPKSVINGYLKGEKLRSAIVSRQRVLTKRKSQKRG